MRTNSSFFRYPGRIVGKDGKPVTDFRGTF